MSGKGLERSMIPGIPGPFGGASDEACSAITGPGSFEGYTPRTWQEEWTRQTRPIGEYQPYAVPSITTHPQRLEPEKRVQAPLKPRLA